MELYLYNTCCTKTLSITTASEPAAEINSAAVNAPSIRLEVPRSCACLSGSSPSISNWPIPGTFLNFKSSCKYVFVMHIDICIHMYVCVGTHWDLNICIHEYIIL